ncbi:MAG: DUF484 family protein [Aquabacterium sp.]
MSTDGITEADIANFLAHTPGFFERHAELLASVQLASPHGARAVSLQERQIEMMRERVRGLEAKIIEMIRHGQENAAIADRLHRWTRAVLLARSASELPLVMVRELKAEFLVPQAAIRVWGVDAAFASEPYAQGVSDDTRSFAASLTLPYCGAHAGFEAVRWLDDGATVASVAIIPLRAGGAVIGLLVLGSPDPTRYSADMGTDFLMRLGEVAGAALSRLT